MTTTERGYGHDHQQRRAVLLPTAYGMPCPLCGKTMFASQQLDLHHPVRLADDPTSTATQIVHSTCNRGAVGHRERHHPHLTPAGFSPNVRLPTNADR
jgi:hypothetical protein